MNAESKTILRARERFEEEIHESDLGADNYLDIQYWRGYLDGAKAQLKEDNNKE